jgi:ADP-ribose pyrophosphatase YjhB (NUDIX family)
LVVVMTRQLNRPIARVAIERDDAILVVRHETPTGGFWCLPGGKVDAGESYAAAAVREAAEEAGIIVTLEGVILIVDDAADRLELLFRAVIVAGEPRRVAQVEASLVAVAWQPRAALADDFRPGVFARLVRTRPVAALPVVDVAAWHVA